LVAPARKIEKQGATAAKTVPSISKQEKMKLIREHTREKFEQM
jgi:hypothetical protein